MKFPINFLLLIGYMMIGFVPYFGSIDKAPTQFFYLSLLNSLTIIFFYLNRDLYLKKVNNVLQKTSIFLLFLAVIWSFITQYNAINTEEVYIYTSRLLLYLVALINLIVLIQSSTNIFSKILNVATLFLVIETILVLYNYYERYGLVTGRDMGLRAFTGNINITGIAMLLKVPFYLLAMYKLKGRLKLILTILFPVIIYTILLLGSKLANIILITTLFVVLIKFVFSFSKKLFAYNFVVVVCFIIPFLVNTYQYKNDKVINVVERTSNFNSKSTSERVRFYKQALNAISNNPVMGIGAGNWKINSLEYEKEYLVDYTVPINVHNDFLETAAEIGLVGFFLKYYIYIILFILLIQYLKKNKISESLLVILSSLIIFFLDSSINFPFQRPVVYVFHLILLALIFGKIDNSLEDEDSSIKNNYLGLIILFVFSIITILPSYLVFDSYRDQNPLIAGIKLKKEYLSKQEVLNIRSNFPTISALTIPLDVYKANYLLNTKNLSDTILKLIDKGSKYNPFSYSGYAIKSVYYINKDNIDSAEYYAKKAFYSQSNNNIHFYLYTDILSLKKDSLELTNAYEYLKKPVRQEFTEKYLRHVNSIQSGFNQNQKEIIEKYKLDSDNFFNALNIIDKIGKDDVFKAVTLSKEGEDLYQKKQYSPAAIKFEEAIRLNPLEIAYYDNCANSYMKSGKSKKAIEVLEAIDLQKFNTKGKTEYLLGVLYIDIGENQTGCKFFDKAQNKGFKISKDVIALFCQESN